MHLSKFLLSDEGYIVYGLNDVKTVAQIANFVGKYPGKYLVASTDRGFFGLVKGVERVFSPVLADSWFLDVSTFRQIVSAHARADLSLPPNFSLSPLDLFVVYNLAPNESMQARIADIDFSTAVSKLAKWLVAGGKLAASRPNHIRDYRGLLSSLSSDANLVDSVEDEMSELFSEHAWDRYRSRNLEEIGLVFFDYFARSNLQKEWYVSPPKIEASGIRKERNQPAKTR